MSFFCPHITVYFWISDVSQKMECVFKDASVFVKIIDGIKELCSEGNLDFTGEGLQMQVMDASHVSLCSMLMKTKLFESYKCTEPMSLGINFKSLAMMLRGANGTLKLKSNNATLEVAVQKMTGTAKYTMNLMDIDSEYLAVPQTSYAAICLLASSTFGKVMRDQSDFSDTCTIDIGETISVSASGEIGKVEWKSDDCKCNLQGDSHALQFSLRYLSLFSKCAVSPKVIISMSPDKPLCLTFPIEEHGYMRFYLAPKIVE
jgi:proliferating cell nuclear antigen